MKVVILCIVVSSLSIKFADAQCQTQSASNLNKMLMNAGGTLNTQIVATNWEQAKNFKSHFLTTSRTVQLSKRQMDIAQDRFERKLMRMMRTRDRRSVGSTVIRTCFSPMQVVEGGFHHTCNNCDATTTLPSNYYPRYINQIICDPNKPKVCFQNEGECKSRFMALTFLKKTGNCVTGSNGILLEEWAPVVMNVGICCECMIKTTSFFVFFL